MRYRSTRCSDVASAKTAIEAHLTRINASAPSFDDAKVAVVPQVILYFDEHGSQTIGQQKSDSIGPILRAFIAFLKQDAVGIGCTFPQLTPTVWQRFVKWRSKPHSYKLVWKGRSYEHQSDGVAQATIKKNLRIITAALNHAVENNRANRAPLPGKKLLATIVPNKRNRTLSDDELGAILGYCRSDEPLWHFVTLMLATAMRPEAALLMVPKDQFDAKNNLLDLHPVGAPLTKKRNPVVPCIAPFAAMIAEHKGPWIQDENGETFQRLPVRWRTMRRVLGLDEKIVPKTLRHTVATRLAELGVDSDQRTRLMGHAGDNATNDIYVHYDPKTMAPARAGLDTIWEQGMAAADRWCAELAVATGANGKIVLVDRAKLDADHSPYVRLDLDQSRTPEEREEAATKRRNQINKARNERRAAKIDRFEAESRHLVA